MLLLKAELPATPPTSCTSGPARIGRYEVLSMLAPAPMGAVYRAVDQAGHSVVIRTFELALAGEGRAEFVARFYREANDARLNHTNIVAIRDVSESDGLAYIAMDYPEGESLRTLLDSGTALSIRQVVEIAAGVASGLHHAHENHVVHGDIRPENIVVAPGGDAKIMNFCIAQTAAWPPQVGTGLGTPYRAPEQVAGGNTDGHADIFALGAVLYEMLTGVTPFDDADPSAVADKILKAAPVPPSSCDVRVPPVFDRIVGRALAKRPKDRYQTGLALARDLQDAGGTVSCNETLMAVPPTASRAPGTGLVAIPPFAGPAERNDPPPQPRLMPLLLAMPIVLVGVWVTYPQSPQPPADAGAVALSAEAPALPEQEVAIQPADLTPPSGSVIPAASPDTHAAAEPPSTPSRISAPPPKATLAVAVSPWGEVYVNGKSVGVSPPLTTLELDAGKHRVEIRNHALEPYRNTVNLKPGKALKIKHKFR